MDKWKKKRNNICMKLGLMKQIVACGKFLSFIKLVFRRNISMIKIWVVLWGLGYTSIVFSMVMTYFKDSFKGIPRAQGYSLYPKEPHILRTRALRDTRYIGP